MSNNESFIDEVNEEVQRDKLFQLLRKYGWIGVVVVLVLVGGTAFNEWRKAQDRAAAEGLGDAFLAAVEADDAAERAAALAGIPAEGNAAVLRDRMVDYAMTIPDYQGAVKEWRWRNGWFVHVARHHGIALPVHDRLCAMAGVS